MMLRTQVQLTEEQHRRLSAFARRESVSVAEAVRMSVTRFLDEQAVDRCELSSRAAEMIGTLQDRDGAADLSTSHDDHLDEAFS